MANGSPRDIREVRIICSTSFPSNHTNAASDAWLAATKVLPSSYDAGGLQQDGFADDTVKTRLFDQGAPTPGLVKGTYKMGFRGLGAAATTTPTPEQVLLNAILGDIKSPVTNRNVACAAGSSTTILNIPSINSYLVPGQAVLVGRRGDGRGGGEVKPVIGANAAAIILGFACNGAPLTGDPVVISTTCFLNEDSPQSYIQHLAIGHATADQKQTIGGMAKLSFKGLGMSERPEMDLDITPADWQTVPTTDRASLQHANVPSYGTVAFSKGTGLLHIGDYNTTTRVAYRYGDISHDPGLTYDPVPGPGGVNGREGWQKKKGVPTTSVTLLYDQDMPGLESDFTAGTAKHVIAQFGTTMGACFAIEHQKAYLSELPSDKAVGSLSGVSVKLHGTDDYNASSNIRSAAVRYHSF